MAIPTISDVSPPSGPAAGGTDIVITGTNFTGATAVSFLDDPDLYAMSGFVVDSDTQIRAVTPHYPHLGTIVNTQVVTPGGSNDNSSADAFTYIGDGTVIPPGDASCIQVFVGSFIGDGSTADGDGIVYTVEAVDGWYDSIPMRSALLEAQPRGETIVVAHEGGRTIDVKITAHSAVAGEALGAILCFTATYTIKTAFRAVFVPISFRVVDAYADRTLLARRIGPIKESILGNSAAVTFSIPMLGEDPRRFAT